MKRREILQKIPAPPKKEEPDIKKSDDFNETEIFEIPLPETEEMINSEPEKPKSKRKPPPPEAAAKGREVAARNRTIKAKERRAEVERLKSLAEENKEKLMLKRLQEKYGKTELTAFDSEIEPEPVAPPPRKKTVAKPPSRQTQSLAPSVDAEPTPHIPQPIVDERTQPYQHVDSITSNSYQHTLDYDRIINGLAERMERKHLSDKEVHERIRQKAYEEGKKEADLYKDKYSALQRERTISTLTKRNPVFERSRDIRNTYTSRFQRGWYGR